MPKHVKKGKRKKMVKRKKMGRKKVSDVQKLKQRKRGKRGRKRKVRRKEMTNLDNLLSTQNIATFAAPFISGLFGAPIDPMTLASTTNVLFGGFNQLRTLLN